MPISKYKRDECERVAKRLKKSEFAAYLIRLEEEHDRKLELMREEGKRSAMVAIKAAELKLRADAEQLTPIRTVLRLVLREASNVDINDTQLQLMLDTGTPNSLPNELQTPHVVLAKLLESCNTFCEKFGVDNPGFAVASYDEMENALGFALADRETLLKRLGMTDREWSMSGGTSYTDVEP